MPSSRDLPNSGTKLATLMCPELAGRFFTSVIWEAPFTDRPLDELINEKGEKKQEQEHGKE